MAEPVCVISGVGPGTGSALVRRFAAEGYRIAMLARNAERLADLAGQVPSAKAYVCDVSDQSQVDAAMALVEREMGAPSVLIHNAVGGAWGTFMEIDPAVLNRNFQVNTMGLLYLARRVAPAMVAAGQGRNHCHRKYVGAARSGEFCGLRTDESGATHPRRGDGAGPGTEGRACCLHCHRCRDRRALGPRALQEQARRLFHRASGNCR